MDIYGKTNYFDIPISEMREYRKKFKSKRNLSLFNIFAILLSVIIIASDEKLYTFFTEITENETINLILLIFNVFFLTLLFAVMVAFCLFCNKMINSLADSTATKSDLIKIKHQISQETFKKALHYLEHYHVLCNIHTEIINLEFEKENFIRK